MPLPNAPALRRALALSATATLTLAACQDPVSVAGRPSAAADGAARAAAEVATRDAAREAPALATLAWNRVARDLVVKYNVSAPASIRTFALLGVAEYNAIVLVDREAADHGDRGAGPRRRLRQRGALAGAAAAALAYVHPQETAFLEGLVDEQRDAEQRDSAQREGPQREGTQRGRPEDFAAGEAIGRAVAAALVDRARTDGYFAPFTGTVPVCNGCWLATTPPGFATLGQARSYLLADNAQFRPPPPPAFGSLAFKSALAEVRHLADTRTAEQDSIARFWALPVGTVGAQGHLNQVAADLIARHGRSEREAARVLALLNVGAYDALVASHEAKYHYWLIRPSQADPAIVRAIGLPSFPSYPSNHSALVGVAATVLGRFFPAERARLDAMAEEGGLSRLYGGIHYRFDVEAGLALGRRVGAWTLRHATVGRGPIVPR